MALYGGVTVPGKPDLENVKKLDLLPVPMIRHMQRVGIAIDIPYLAALSSELGREMIELEKDIANYIPPESLHLFVDKTTAIEEEEGAAQFNANSADQIRTLLFDLIKVGGTKDLKRTKGGLVSTGKKNLDMTRDSHPIVATVLQYKERAKLKSAFTDALPKLAKYHPKGDCPICEMRHVGPTMRLHSEFPTTRAVTGRLASKKPNTQQIPSRTSLGVKMRAAFMASNPGTRLVSVDFSQMELRDFAHLSNSRTMCDVYASDGDIHQTTAMKTFQISDPSLVDKMFHRMPSKVTNFSIVNGSTGRGLLAQLVGNYAAVGKSIPDWLNEGWCDDFIRKWFGVYDGTEKYLELQHYRARRYGFVWDSFGRIRYIPEVQSVHEWIRSAGLRQAQNFAITADNAAQTKLVMAECEDLFVDLANDCIQCWPLLSIHDQVIAEVEEDYAEAVGGRMAQIFSDVMIDKQTGENYWRVPIKGDCEITQRWKKEG